MRQMNSLARPDDPATAWVRDVVEGRIVSGELAIRACRRHLDDLERGHERGLIWKPEAAAKALRFFPAMLTVTAGAKAGERFNLPSYTAFVVGSLFGWHRADGRLRFRTAWVEAGKGQIKSPVAAARRHPSEADCDRGKPGDEVVLGQRCSAARRAEQPLLREEGAARPYRWPGRAGDARGGE